MSWRTHSPHRAIGIKAATILTDNTHTTYYFEGYANTGSDTVAGRADNRWLIVATRKSDGAQLWPAGSNTPDKIWDNRAGYSYS